MGWRCRWTLGIWKNQLIPIFQLPVQIRIGKDQGTGGFVAWTLWALIYLAPSVNNHRSNRVTALGAARRNLIDGGVANLRFH
jgi:hypothetical protein